MDEFKIILSESCSVKTQIFNCFNIFSTSYKLYLQTKDETLNDKFIRVLRQWADYACKNNGQNMLSLRNENNAKCSERALIVDNVDACVPANLFKLHRENTFTDFINLLQQNQCRTVVDVKQCIVQNLSACERNTEYQIFGELFNLLAVEFECATS